MRTRRDGSIKDRFLSVSCILFFITVIAGSAHGQEQKNSWELVLGGGNSLDGDHFRHALIAPALSITPPDQKLLVYRIEGDIELIKAKSTVTAVIGVAPFLRLFMSSHVQAPFVEIGAGANVMTSNHTGRKNPGGAFIFSLMGGAGYKFPIHDRPFAVSLRFRHLSNSNLYSPNEGMNALLFVVSVGL